MPKRKHRRLISSIIHHPQYRSIPCNYQDAILYTNPKFTYFNKEFHCPQSANLFRSIMTSLSSIPKTEGWTSVSQVYTHVERITLPLAHQLVTFVHTHSPLSSPTATVFDNGSGTGVLIVALKTSFPSLPILAKDASPGMVSILSRRVAENGWKDVQTWTLDARKLEGITDDSFTHVFSTFMICLAPESDLIASEMYRVIKPGGVLGLAVWADPYFGFSDTPWTKACRKVMPDYEAVAPMDGRWSRTEDVKTNLELREERIGWRWGSVDELVGYFFDGGNPGNEIMIESFRERGGDVGVVRGVIEGVVGEMYEREGGACEGDVVACLVVARK